MDVVRLLIVAIPTSNCVCVVWMVDIVSVVVGWMGVVLKNAWFCVVYTFITIFIVVIEIILTILTVDLFFISFLVVLVVLHVVIVKIFV